MEKLLTPGDVAERCQISTKTVLGAIDAGRLRASRLGEQRAFRVRAEDVERWIGSSVVTRRFTATARSDGRRCSPFGARAGLRPPHPHARQRAVGPQAEGGDLPRVALLLSGAEKRHCP